MPTFWMISSRPVFKYHLFVDDPFVFTSRSDFSPEHQQPTLMLLGHLPGISGSPWLEQNVTLLCPYPNWFYFPLPPSQRDTTEYPLVRVLYLQVSPASSIPYHQVLLVSKYLQKFSTILYPLVKPSSRHSRSFIPPCPAHFPHGGQGALKNVNQICCFPD